MIAGNAWLWRARARFPSLLRRCHHSAPPRSSTSSKRPMPWHQQHGSRYHTPRCFASVGGVGGGGSHAGGDDGDEEWLAPDHSPLFANNFEAENSPHQVGDEIEVIDLEATLNNPSNREFLKEGSGSMEEVPSSEFDVQSSNVGWKEILRELKEEGEIEMMNGLVKEYKLQSYLDALDDDDDDVDLEENDDDDDIAATVEEDEEWDEELEESLEGLSQEELIDELIENSPSLSQLEIEILSDELERSERGEQDGLDFETLEDSDLNENAAVRDFRAMVLEDYHEKKRAREAKRTGAGGGGKTLDGGSKRAESTTVSMTDEQSAATNSSTSSTSDFSSYPPDWEDYDSKAAFQRDFSEDDESWIPPSSELIPSRSLKIDEIQGEDGRDPPKDADPSMDDLDGAIDWLRARRSRLGDVPEDNMRTPTRLLIPEEAEKFSHQNSQIPIVKHTLFTTSELSTSLAAQGGTDIHIIDTEEFDATYGVGIGCNFIMLVTGRGPSHIRVLADSVVRNLKARKLDERNVMGAMQGAEGGQDIFSNKRSRNRARRNGAANTSRKIDDDWMVVDCENIHVHILEASTRRCLNIEGLWDLSNPDSDGSKLRRVDFNDDDDVDTYVAENPIPEEYAAKIFNEGGGTGGWMMGGGGGRVLSVPSAFQKKSFSEKWSGKGKARRRSKR